MDKEDRECKAKQWIKKTGCKGTQWIKKTEDVKVHSG